MKAADGSEEEAAAPCLTSVWKTLDLLPCTIWQLPGTAFVQYPLLCVGLGLGLELDKALDRGTSLKNGLLANAAPDRGLLESPSQPPFSHPLR